MPSLPPDPTKTGLLFNIYFCMRVCMSVWVCMCACIQVCFVLYVIYSQHCKHTETIIHVLALVHWIWLTSLEHHKRSNDLGWTRTQWRDRGLPESIGWSLKSLLLLKVGLTWWWKSCHRVWKVRDRAAAVLTEGKNGYSFLHQRRTSSSWRNHSDHGPTQERGKGLFRQAFIENWVYAVLVSLLHVKSPFKVSLSLCLTWSEGGRYFTLSDEGETENTSAKWKWRVNETKRIRAVLFTNRHAWGPLVTWWCCIVGRVSCFPESLASILHSARANIGWRWVALYTSPCIWDTCIGLLWGSASPVLLCGPLAPPVWSLSSPLWSSLSRCFYRFSVWKTKMKSWALVCCSRHYLWMAFHHWPTWRTQVLFYWTARHHSKRLHEVPHVLWPLPGPLQSKEWCLLQCTGLCRTPVCHLHPRPGLRHCHGSPSCYTWQSLFLWNHLPVM